MKDNIAAAPPIPVLFSAAFTSGAGWNGGEAYANVFIGSAADGSPGQASGNGENMTFVAVFDREKPNSAPVFSASAPNNTTPPAGLDSYLTDQFILFVATAAFVSQVPQGELFTLLMANGGDSKLRQMETLGTHFACGVGGNLVYLLASVPGTGLPGLEFLQIRSEAAPSSPTAPQAYTNSPYQMLMELIPGADGLYTPMQYS